MRRCSCSNAARKNCSVLVETRKLDPRQVAGQPIKLTSPGASPGGPNSWNAEGSSPVPVGSSGMLIAGRCRILATLPRKNRWARAYSHGVHVPACGADAGTRTHWPCSLNSGSARVERWPAKSRASPRQDGRCVNTTVEPNAQILLWPERAPDKENLFPCFPWMRNGNATAFRLTRLLHQRVHDCQTTSAAWCPIGAGAGGRVGPLSVTPTDVEGIDPTLCLQHGGLGSELHG